MKTKRKLVITLMITLLLGSIIIPIILRKITYVKAGRIEVQITWNIFWCKYSRDSDPDGEFYLQFKYYTGTQWRIEKTQNRKIEPNWPNPSYPNIQYTLKKDVEEGNNLYIRLLEKDWLKNDLIIPVYIKNHGSGDSVYWYSFYISSSFEAATCYYESPYNDMIEVTFLNMGQTLA